jgi:hypothetical protein
VFFEEPLAQISIAWYHIAFNFDHIFLKNCASIRILASSIFVLVFFKESCSGICRKQIASNLNCVSVNIMYQFKIYHGAVLPQYSARKHMMESIPSSHITFSSNCLNILCTLWPCRSSAVRRWLPTVAARVRVRAACGVSDGQNSTGAGFLRVLRFPLPIIPPISPSS